MRGAFLVASLAVCACGSRSSLDAFGDEGAGAACAVAFDESGTGETSCPGCPELTGGGELFYLTSESTFLIRPSKLGTISGQEGPGRWRIDSPEGTNEGAVPITPDGSYDTIAPLFCGLQSFRIGWCNEHGTTLLGLEIERTECQTGGLHVTLSWGAGANDLELHLIRQGGLINDSFEDCTWTTCVPDGPDWGTPGVVVDNPHKDIDWLSENGIENIELSVLEPIGYHVLVEYWGGGVPIVATLVINQNGTTTALSPSLEHMDVWVAAQIDGLAGGVQTSATVVDCSGAWTSGCQLPIP